MFVRDGFGHERSPQDDDTAHDKQDDAKVEVVDSTYDGGTVAGGVTAACAVSKLCYHPGQANGEANQKSPKSSLQREMRKKHADFINCLHL